MLYLQVVVSTLTIYLFLVALISVLGRRSLSQLSSLDLIVLMLLGSAVETAMIKGNTALKVGLVSAATLFVANLAIAFLIDRSSLGRKFLCAPSVLLVHDGQIMEANMKRIGFTRDDLLEALRAKECDSVEDVRFAVLEPDGQINIVLGKQSAV